MDKGKSVLFEIKELDLQIKKRIVKACKESMIEISPAQSKLLFYLRNNDNKLITQKDLEKITFLSKSTLSEMISNMQKEGLIIKTSSNTDNRIKYISLSSKAYECINQSEKEFSKLEKSIINNVSEEQLNKFFEILSVFKENLK